MADDDWVVVVPVKTLASAKSRLAELAGDLRPALALAMAVDTVSAAARTDGVAEVIVVTADPDVAAGVSAFATPVTEEPRGLIAAFEFGIATARKRHAERKVALLVSDLPALRPNELELALRHAALGNLVVADAAGTGSTLLASPTPALLRPAFGDGSLARHRDLGAAPLDPAGTLGLFGLRQDVDTPADLEAALALGVGNATAAVVHELDHARVTR